MVAAAVAAAVFTIHRPAPDQLAGHAFAVPSGPDRTVVEVLNGSGRAGLARVATRVLRREGIDVVLLGNADATVDSTRIVIRRGERARGDQVRAVLGAGRIVVQTDTLRRVDVTVVLGPDFRGPAEMHP